MREPRVRATVIAAARALAERTGLEILDVRAEDAGIELTLHAEEATAVGFAAELRRITNAWHHARSGESLWPGRTDRDGDLRDDDADDASF
ncbi:MAG: hypothetical protein EA378_05815 [Phycisphaerales bacterium]|nr:MAG: hypothetical protein EA378_05815 [Phycisphaerales bacterium]